MIILIDFQSDTIIKLRFAFAWKLLRVILYDILNIKLTIPHGLPSKSMAHINGTFHVDVEKSVIQMKLRLS